MKKLFAILLAALLLLNIGAFAEGAATMTANNVRIETMGQTIEIPGLNCTLALDTINDLPSLALLIDGDGQSLFRAIGQMTTTQFQFAVDGMDHGYFEPLPADSLEQMAQVDPAQLAQAMPALIPGLNSLELPAFTGIDIPKLELDDMLSKYITTQNAGSYDFEIPHEEVNELLEMLVQAGRAQGTEGIEEMAQMLQMMKNQGMGLTVRGHVVDDGSTLNASAGLFMVQNGTVSTYEIASLTVVSSLNSFQGDLSMAANGNTSNVMTVTLTSDPAAATLDFSMDVAGTMTITFNMFKEDGLQKAALRMSESSGSTDIVFAYGQQNGQDVVDLCIKSADMDFDLAVNTAMGADNVRTGTLTMTVNGSGTDMLLTADIEMRTDGQIDVGDFTMPSDLRPFSEMNDSEFTAAFQPVSDYIQNNARQG